MVDVSDDDDYYFLKTPPIIELFKRASINTTYKRQRRRSKIETGSFRITNDQEIETCTANHSTNVGDYETSNEQNKNELSSLASKNGEAKDVQVSTSSAASTSLGNNALSLAPETPEIIPKKLQKRKKLTDECPESQRKGCRRSLDFKGPNKTVKKPDNEDRILLTYFNDIFNKRRMTYIDDFTKEPDNEDQKNVKESLHKQIKSFVSCMNRIQGDRKFSQWKGSVMDSIAGAYLAQNVNDVLSSSAFMTLAAKFPRETVSPVEASSSGTRSVKVKQSNDACSNNVHKRKAATKDRGSKTRNRNKKQDAELVNVLKDYYTKYQNSKNVSEPSDSIDWELVRMAKVGDISKAIKTRGMSNNLAKRIKDCLDYLEKTFGSTDVDWLLDVPPHQAKEFLMSIYGLGVKTVECILLLTLQKKAFPIDTNAGRVVSRLGWVPLKQLEEGEEFHKIKEYPHVNLIQTYLWQHLSELEWSILYELHCQLITFGKVFCTERNPSCGRCPMKDDCKYFRSLRESVGLDGMDIEDYSLTKLGRRTKHQVYVLPDDHDLLAELEAREVDDSCPYLFAVSVERDGCMHEEAAVYGTILIPVRTATRGMFPLNGTFFQANEVLADDESSEVPIKVPRASLMNLQTTALYCGNSMLQICIGMTSDEVQTMFKRGFVCFRGFNKKTREPKPLPERFRIQASKAGKINKKRK